MKLSALQTIVTEAIHLTHLQPRVRKLVLDALYKAVNELGTEVDTAQDATREVISTVSDDLVRNIKPLFNSIGVAKGTLAFRRNMKPNGQVDGLRVLIHRRMLEAVVEPLITDAFDRTGDASNIIPTSRGSWTSPLAELVSVIIHEMVHLVQHSSQSHRKSYEYRSYLEKDTDKFHAALDKLSTDASFAASASVHDTHRLYLASPQEIPAFAHEQALKLVRLLGLDSDGELELSKREVMDEVKDILPDLISKMFANRSNPTEYAVYKRYAKLVYQEVMHYLDTVVFANQ